MIDKKTSKQIVDNITATLFVGASAVAAYAGYEVFEQSDFTYLQAQGGLFGFLQALLTLINLLYWFKKGAKYIVRKDNELADNGQDWIFKAFCEQWALSIIRWAPYYFFMGFDRKRFEVGIHRVLLQHRLLGYAHNGQRGVSRTVRGGPGPRLRRSLKRTVDACGRRRVAGDGDDGEPPIRPSHRVRGTDRSQHRDSTFITLP